MNRTKIEWCDYTINPVKGLCPMACDYCYARRMYKRFKWNPEAKYDSDWWQSLRRIKAGNKIFVGSTFELFHDSMSDWLYPIFKWVRVFNDLTFIFLTKQPQKLIKWSPFPENCWVGVTATHFVDYLKAIGGLASVKASIRFISFEPLLGRINHDTLPSLEASINEGHFNWLIIGQQTPFSVKTEPKIEWIKEIVEAADKAGIPVFLKDNLLELINYQSPKTEFAFNKEGFYRQEMPIEKRSNEWKTSETS